MHELITEDDYENLPEEADLRFVKMEGICRANMTRLITDQTSHESDLFVRLQYMAMIAGAADALGIDGIIYPHHLTNPADGLSDFMLSVSRSVSGIRLRAYGGRSPLTVRLGAGTRGKIEQQIQILRDIISTEQMTEHKRNKLLERLEELSRELSQNRVSFGKVMAVLSQISLAVVSGTSFLANAPHAIATISSLLGADKEAEENEAKRLGPPLKQKALPDYSSSSNRAGRMPEITDDDIPF